MDAYPVDVEVKMQRLFRWLSEKDRRRYAAVEAAKLGHGGVLAMGTPAGRRTIRRLLKQWNVGRRTARKKKTMGHHPDRNAQFENIARLRQEYQAAGDPVISIDTKKKELLGNFHRPGQTYTQQTVETFDHDFGSAAQGKLIPHGIYDVVRQHAAIHLNTTPSTITCLSGTTAPFPNQDEIRK